MLFRSVYFKIANVNIVNNEKKLLILLEYSGSKIYPKVKSRFLCAIVESGCALLNNNIKEISSSQSNYYYFGKGNKFASKAKPL